MQRIQRVFLHSVFRNYLIKAIVFDLEQAYVECIRNQVCYSYEVST